MNQLIESTLDALVVAIETSTAEWVRDWVAVGMPQNWTTRRPYHGINVLLLWSAGSRASYPSSQWATYKQWLAAGYQVKSGERSTAIFITKDALKRGGDKDNPDDHYRMLRCAFVFNAAQLTLPPAVEVVKLAPIERIAACERIVEASGAAIRGGGQPQYSPSLDVIEMPDIGVFTSAEGYYATLFHELVHWTGHHSRLARFGRDMKTYTYGGYAEEELVAELGGAFMCAGLTVDYPLDNFASYLRTWLKRTKDPKRELMRAASAAGKATEMLMVSRETQEEKVA